VISVYLRPRREGEGPGPCFRSRWVPAAEPARSSGKGGKVEKERSRWSGKPARRGTGTFGRVALTAAGVARRVAKRSGLTATRRNPGAVNRHGAPRRRHAQAGRSAAAESGGRQSGTGRTPFMSSLDFGERKIDADLGRTSGRRTIPPFALRPAARGGCDKAPLGWHGTRRCEAVGRPAGRAR